MQLRVGRDEDAMQLQQVHDGWVNIVRMIFESLIRNCNPQYENHKRGSIGLLIVGLVSRHRRN